MPSLKDQLRVIEDKEQGHHMVFERLRSLNSSLEAVKWISGLLSFAFVVAFFFILYTYIIRNPNVDLAYILTFYGGMALVWLLHTKILNPLLESFTYFLYNIKKKEYKAITELKESFQAKKYEIQKLIKEETKKVFKERERKLIEQLDSLVDLAEKKKLPIAKIEEIKNKLVPEHIEIRDFGYQIHTNIYYTNRFTKINQALLPPNVGPAPTRRRHHRKPLLNQAGRPAACSPPGYHSGIPLLFYRRTCLKNRARPGFWKIVSGWRWY